MKHLAALVLVAACSDPTGALLAVEGTVKFDRVEVYFGDAAGTKVPTTPLRPTRLTDEAQLLLHRRFLPDDAGERLAVPQTTWSYLVPAVGENLKLGTYALVIASLEGAPVGIGELFDFEVPTDDVVYRYPIPLVPIANQDFERWGRTERDCVRWTRPRDAGRPVTLAVVHADDSDCDSFLDEPASAAASAADCEPLQFCDGSGTGGCVGHAGCAGLSTPACVGTTCTNRDGETLTCVQSTCIEESLCSPCGEGEPDELLACAIDEERGGGGHLDYGLPVKNGLALCSEPYDVGLRTSFPCKDPRVVASANWMAGGTFEFTMSETATANVCLLHIVPTTPSAPFTSTPHVLISIATPPGAPLPRAEFVIGLEMSNATCSPDTLIVNLTTDLDSCGF